MMETRVKHATERHKRGYNCAQAVACTYCDLFGMDEEAVFKMMEGFGSGMGAMEQACGAVSGAVALAGMKNSNGIGQPISRAETYQLTKQMMEAFKHKNQALTCGELKGLGTGQRLRSCPGCVQDAAEIVEQVLFRE